MEAVFCTPPEYRWPLLSLLPIVVPFPVVSRGGTGNEPVISLRPSSITEHHFESNLNDLAREVAPRFTKPSLGISDWLEMITTRLLVVNSSGIPCRSKLRASECQATDFSSSVWHRQLSRRTPLRSA